MSTNSTSNQNSSFTQKSKLTFISGNKKKVEYLTKYLGIPVDHINLNLEEIQSLNLNQIVEHKVKLAYQTVKKPVIVEDVSLEFAALGGLPGPFIKFFIQKMSLNEICAMISNGATRKATARCVIGYFDGSDMKLFEGSLEGEISLKPYGNNGFGWDKIFIPDGFQQTRASLNSEDDRKTYLQIKPFEKLKKYLDTN